MSLAERRGLEAPRAPRQLSGKITFSTARCILQSSRKAAQPGAGRGASPRRPPAKPAPCPAARPRGRAQQPGEAGAPRPRRGKAKGSAGRAGREGLRRYSSSQSSSGSGSEPTLPGKACRGGKRRASRRRKGAFPSRRTSRPGRRGRKRKGARREAWPRAIPVTLLLEVPVTLCLAGADGAARAPCPSPAVLVADGDVTEASGGRKGPGGEQLGARQEGTASRGRRRGALPKGIVCQQGAGAEGEEKQGESEAGSAGWWESLQSWLLSLEIYLENAIKD